jgi:hypothetical protein
MDENTVRKLAGAADLPLTDERAAVLAPQLGAWLSAANELNAKLSADEHRDVLPITTFSHPGAEGSDE